MNFSSANTISHLSCAVNTHIFVCHSIGETAESHFRCPRQICLLTHAPSARLYQSTGKADGILLFRLFKLVVYFIRVEGTSLFCPVCLPTASNRPRLCSVKVIRLYIAFNPRRISSHVFSPRWIIFLARRLECSQVHEGCSLGPIIGVALCSSPPALNKITCALRVVD